MNVIRYMNFFTKTLKKLSILYNFHRAYMCDPACPYILVASNSIDLVMFYCQPCEFFISMYRLINQ